MAVCQSSAQNQCSSTQTSESVEPLTSYSPTVEYKTGLMDLSKLGKRDEGHLLEQLLLRIRETKADWRRCREKFRMARADFKAMAKN